MRPRILALSIHAVALEGKRMYDIMIDSVHGCLKKKDKPI